METKINLIQKEVIKKFDDQVKVFMSQMLKLIDEEINFINDEIESKNFDDIIKYYILQNHNFYCDTDGLYNLIDILIKNINDVSKLKDQKTNYYDLREYLLRTIAE